MGADPWVVLQHVPYEGPGALAPGHRATRAPTSQLVRIDHGDAVPTPDDVGAMRGARGDGRPDGRARRPALARGRAGAAPGRGRSGASGARGVPRRATAGGGTGGRSGDGAGARVRRGRGPPHRRRPRRPRLRPRRRRRCRACTGTATPSPCPRAPYALPPTRRTRTRPSASGPCAYGLQFHVEVTGSLVAHWGPHLPPGMFVRAADVAHVSRAGDGHRAAVRRAGRGNARERLGRRACGSWPSRCPRPPSNRTTTSPRSGSGGRSSPPCRPRAADSTCSSPRTRWRPTAPSSPRRWRSCGGARSSADAASLLRHADHALVRKCWPSRGGARHRRACWPTEGPLDRRPP